MHTHTMTDTLANNSVLAHNSTPNFTLVRKSSVAEQCILLRFSKWLWSGVIFGRSGPSDGLLGPSQQLSGDAHCASTWPPREANGATEPTKQITAISPTIENGEIPSGPSGQLQDDDAVLQALPCRACKAWGVACDLQKPQCSHCMDQQLLCFYVAPLRLTMKRSKKVPRS